MRKIPIVVIDRATHWRSGARSIGMNYVGGRNYDLFMISSRATLHQKFTLRKLGNATE